MPVPKYCCQKRLTVTRAVSGFCGSTIQLANDSRLGGASCGQMGTDGGRDAGLDLLALAVISTAEEHEHVARLGHVLHDQRAGRRQFGRSQLFARSGQLLIQGREDLARAAEDSLHEVFSQRSPLTGDSLGRWDGENSTDVSRKTRGVLGRVDLPSTKRRGERVDRRGAGSPAARRLARYCLARRCLRG